MLNTAFLSIYNGNNNNVRIVWTAMTPVKPQDNKNAGPKKMRNRKNNKSSVFHARKQNARNTATNNANTTKGKN